MASRKSDEKVECPHCKENVRKGGLKKHQESKTCKAAQARNFVEAKGLVTVSYKVTDLLTALGIEYNYYTTRYTKGGWGKSYSRSDDYAEKWVALASTNCDDYSYESYKSTGPSNIEVARALFVAKTDPETRDMFLATSAALDMAALVSTSERTADDTNQVLMDLIRSVAAKAEADGIKTDADDLAYRLDKRRQDYLARQLASKEKFEKRRLADLEREKQERAEREERERVAAAFREIEQREAAEQEAEELAMDAEQDWSMEP